MPKIKSAQKDLKNFTPLVDQLLVDEKAPHLFHHQIFLINKLPPNTNEVRDKHKHKWFVKKVSPEIAIMETISQELLRLMYPDHQPKTRIARDEEDNWYIISKEVPECHNTEKLDKDEHDLLREYLSQGKLKGLGGLIILMIWLKENDIKLGNLLLDKSFHFVKIDSEQTYSIIPFTGRVYSRNNYQITPELIAHLPFNYKGHYQSYHWFDQLVQYQNANNYYKDKGLFKKDMMYYLGKYPWLNNEINQMILQVILLPTEFLDYFIKLHIPEDYPHANEMFNVIKSILTISRNELYTSALKLPEFRKYIVSEEAFNDGQQFFQSLEKTKLAGGARLQTSPGWVGQHLSFIQQKAVKDMEQLALYSPQSESFNAVVAPDLPIPHLQGNFQPYPTASMKSQLKRTLVFHQEAVANEPIIPHAMEEEAPQEPGAIPHAMEENAPHQEHGAIPHAMEEESSLYYESVDSPKLSDHHAENKLTTNHTSSGDQSASFEKQDKMEEDIQDKMEEDIPIYPEQRNNFFKLKSQETSSKYESSPVSTHKMFMARRQHKEYQNAKNYSKEKYLDNKPEIKRRIHRK